MMPQMMNASGPMITDLARKIAHEMHAQIDKGMDMDVAFGVVLSVAVDTMRANLGDRQTKQSVRDFVERRMSKPMEYWGVRPQR